MEQGRDIRLIINLTAYISGLVNTVRAFSLAITHPKRWYAFWDIFFAIEMR